ncbi:mucin-5B-like [Gastrophryne carolinensis]
MSSSSNTSCASGNHYVIQKSEESKRSCTTWGNFHFNTFDRENFPAFTVMIQRHIEEHNVVFFIASVNDVLIVHSKSGITVDGIEFHSFYKRKDLEIKDTCDNFQILGNGISITWDWAETFIVYDPTSSVLFFPRQIPVNHLGDTVTVELDDQYWNKTCGMCGNFDGNPYNDLQWDGGEVSNIIFGNIHKSSEPDDQCPDVKDTRGIDNEEYEHCKEQRKQCEDILSTMGNCKYKVTSFQDFLDTCTVDLCNCQSQNLTSCLCSNLNQFSKDFKSCPSSMTFSDCASPCPNTCSDPAASKLCTDECIERCACPPGTVLDDVSPLRVCVEQQRCPCVHNSKIYQPGESYTTGCLKCNCILGQWTCSQFACSGTCTLKGGSRVHTYDGKKYTFHGDCQYLMSRDTGHNFSVIAKVIRCGMTETSTCLNTVFIHLGEITIKICHCGKVYLGRYSVTLPLIKGEIVIYKYGGYFIYVITPFGISVEVQVKPIFQLTISLESTYQDKTIGLCGNFNGIEADDFKTLSGVVENTGADFCNSFKDGSTCPDVPEYHDNPCARSISKAEYANHWCTRLIDKTDVFAACHNEVDPTEYFKDCKYDVCTLENSEEALCSLLEDYANECRKKNVTLTNWREHICVPECPESMVFSPNPKHCNISCNSLAAMDRLCNFMPKPREGCTCPEGTYMAEEKKCVIPEECPCTYKGKTIQAHHTYKVDNKLCKCIRGILECPRKEDSKKVCKPPMYFYECNSTDPSILGAQCQKSCKTQDMECHNKDCEPGCVCPNHLISDENGGCIPSSQCPCVFGGKYYNQGETIAVSCNTCTCKNRIWECTQNECPKTCTLYGNGHLITFDQSRRDFSGACNYILVQDFCSKDHKEGSFQVMVKNNICSESDTVCSMKLKVLLSAIFHESALLILIHIVLDNGLGKNKIIEIYAGKIEETNTHHGHAKREVNSYTAGIVGQHIVLKTEHLTITYDQKLTATVDVTNLTAATICGLCSSNDGQSNNDLTSPWAKDCISGLRLIDPCSDNPEKLAWAEKHCNIINSDVFLPCHKAVEARGFYDTCVADTCSCSKDIGECECLCASVAAYAAECSKHNICVRWRTPDICPLFCDYYNKEGQCDWHYKPCGIPCLPTCEHPKGQCDPTQRLEGCYPECSAERPLFDMENQMCVSVLNCTVCTDGEKLCDEDTGECLCCYFGRTYRKGEKIASFLEDEQMCEIAHCTNDGILELTRTACGITTGN